MNFKDIRVLVTDGPGRQTLSIIRGLKELGCHVTVLCISRLDICYTSRLPDVKLLDKNAGASAGGFEDFVMEQIKTGKYDVLMPVAENATNRLTFIEDDIKSYVKIACSPRSSYVQVSDKQNTFEHAMDIGIPCPYTRRNDQTIDNYLNNAKFPVIIKPRSGMGSIGFHKFLTEEEFRTALNEGKFDPDDYVIQEFIKFSERYSTHIFLDSKSNINSSVAVEVLRWYPLDAGTAIAIKTISNETIIKYSNALLKDMKYQGFANPSFMIDESDGQPKLLEINGRIPASIKMSFLCGFNISKLLLEAAYDEEVTQYPINSKFGIVTRHSQADWAWFFKSPDRFNCKPSWFSWKNTRDIVFSWDDPLPFISYTIQGLTQYKKKMKKKSHDL